MRAIAIGSVMLLGYTVAAHGQSTKVTTNEEQVLTQMIQEWATALVQKDTVALYRIIAEDYRVTTSNGKVLSRAEDLAPLIEGQLTFDSAAADSMGVRQFGTTAIIVGYGAFRGRYRDRPFTARERFTEVLLKRGNRWQVVQSASTGLPSEAH